HTISKRDWSSDVCSSDLVKRMVREGVGVVPGDLLGEEPVEAGPACQLWQSPGVTETVRQPYAVGLDPEFLDEVPLALCELTHHQIGRASCRGRGEIADEA